jgi:hypothetical protein
MQANSSLSNYLHGEIAMNCRRDRKTAMNYLNLSARYGNQTTQQQLAKMGLPIPAADLMAKKRYQLHHLTRWPRSL